MPDFTSLWAMAAAPLWIGIDIPSMPPAARAILLNRAVVSVDQDPLGVMATKRSASSGTGRGEVWARPLQTSADGRWRGAAMFLNPGDSGAAETVAATRGALGVPPAVTGDVRVTDLWANTTTLLGPALTSRPLAVHDSVMVLLEEA